MKTKEPTPIKEIKEGDICYIYGYAFGYTEFEVIGIDKKNIYAKEVKTAQRIKIPKSSWGSIKKIGITLTREKQKDNEIELAEAKVKTLIKDIYKLKENHQAEMNDLTQFLKKSQEKHARWMVKEHQKEMKKILRELSKKIQKVWEQDKTIQGLLERRKDEE